MKRKSISFLLLSVSAIVFLSVLGCGGGGGGGGGTVEPILPSSADLSLTKTVNIPTPDVDTDVVFTITVSNAGPASATGVLVTDQLPSGFTYVSDSSSSAYNPVTGVWSVGTLAVGANRSIDITATVKGAGNFTNIAEVTAANQSDPDSKPGNGVPNEDDFASATAAPPGIKVSINQIQTDCTTTPGSTDVTAFVTVTDQIGDTVSTLTKNDFTVSEDQTPLAADEFDVEFAEQVPIPLSVSIVMDYSGSIINSGIISDVEKAVIDFIDLMAAVDRGEIIKFDQSVEVVQSFTAIKDALRAAVVKPYNATGGTALYDAIIKGINDTKSEPNTNRKAVIAITDGLNDVGVVNNVGPVIKAAQDNNIPIFTIAVGTKINLVDLTRLADETGGLVYQSTDVNTAEEIYQQLADTLIINQFVFTYNSSLTGGTPATLTIGADFNGLTDSDTRQFTSCP